jgi:hypothetical protein
VTGTPPASLRDFRVWWGLFVFFAIISLLVIQSRYRRWRKAHLLPDLPGVPRAEQSRRLRREGWRLGLMTTSLLVMTGLVFAVFLGAPPTVVALLRTLALVGVVGLLLLSLRL